MAAGGQLPQEDIVKRLNDNLECSICLEQYKDPRVLHCQHSFCALCLKQHIGEAAVIRCPLCNDESEVPKEGIDGMKSNFFIRGLIDDVIGKTSECLKAPKPKCGSCDEGNDAISHCDDCECGLCKDCGGLHEKLKALKLHQVTPLPTEEELLGKMKAENDSMIDKITHDIHDKEAELNDKISQLQKKVKGIESDGDIALTKLRESHKALLLKIDAYVDQMSTLVRKNTEERLGDMPVELAAYQQQLRGYKTLKQQGWMFNNIQIQQRIERCRDLMQQLSDYQSQQGGVVYQGGKQDLLAAKFIDGEAGVKLTSLLRIGLGYLTPLPTRLSRNVNIRFSNMANQMKDELLLILHDALDCTGKYPTSKNSRKTLKDSIEEKVKQKYASHNWSVIVEYGCNMTWSIFNDNMLSVTIDGVDFTLFTPLTT